MKFTRYNTSNRKRSIVVLEKIKKIPGVILILPMIIAAFLNSYFPSLLLIGDPTTALFSSKGTMVFVGMMLVFVGIQIDGGILISSLKRGGILLVTKLLISVIIGYLVLYFFPLDGVFGISTIALVACITSCNPGMYISLMNDYGDELDIANFVLLNLLGLPLIPLFIISISRGQGVNIQSIIAMMIPFLIGFFLGIIDKNLKNVCKNGNALITPFLGFCLGSTINLELARKNVVTGIILFFIYHMVTTLPLLIIDRKFLKQSGHVSAAICCVGGLSISIPTLAMEKNSHFTPYVEIATSQLALVVIMCSLTCPFIVKYFIGKKDRNIWRENL